MKQNRVLALSVALCAAACTPAADTGRSSPEQAPAAEQGGLEPVTNWKSERKRLAMLGLSYEGSVVQRVEAEAQNVLAGLSQADLPRLIEQATSEFQLNRQLDAIASWTRVALLAPDVADHYLSLGLALQGFKLETQAQTAFRHGLSLEPSHVKLNLEVAGIHWKNGDFDQAVEDFEGVLELDDKNAEAWGALARGHFYAERDAQAWEAIHRTQDLGGRIPPQMIALLSARTPEPIR